MDEKHLKNIIYLLAILSLLLVLVYLGIKVSGELKGPDSNKPDVSSVSDRTPEQLKADLIGNKLFYWETAIQSNQIPDFRVLGKSEKDGQPVYNVVLKLDDGNKNKPTYFLDMKYSNGGLSTINTKSIVYNNPIVFNNKNEYEFRPLKDCKIFINTYGETILLKTCPDCSWVSYKVENDDTKELPQTDYISISSKNNAAKSVEFTYVPLAVQETFVSK
ncbi:MAG: hypothetical protein U0T69_10830 [Chitinophagales bacterium]